MKFISVAILLAMAFILVACKTMPPQESVKALLSEMTESTQLQIVKAVSTSMDGKSVKISDNSFSTENRMSVSTNMTATFEGNPINGRVTDKPQHYQLMLLGNACYLIHEETGIEYALENVSCTAM